MNQINIGTKIRELRKKKGITQEALAEVMSVSPQAVSKWESGLTYPDMTMIPLLAGYFEISLDVLFDYDLQAQKAKVEQIINDAWAYFFDDPLRYAETMKAALKDYPGNEALLERLIEAYRRLNENNEYSDVLMELCQKLLSESRNFARVCRMKELQAQICLQKNDYEQAKQILESLPDSVTLKNDAIAFHLKGKDKLNGAILSRCAHLQDLYSVCMEEGDAWFRMEEQKVTFRDFTPADYVPEALKAYRRGLAVLEAFLIEGAVGQDQYLWDGMQTFRWCFYQRIAACQKRLGQTEECERSLDTAYRIITTAWKDFDENRAYYMDPFNQYLRDFDLAEYVQ